MKYYDVIGFGALNVDRLGKVAHITNEGESLVEHESRSVGGSAANTIAALGRLGLKTAYIGTIGNDVEGAMHLLAFRKDHIDTQFIKRKPGTSGVVLGLVDRDGHRLLNIFPGVNNELSRHDIPKAATVHTKIVHLSSFVHTKQFRIQQDFVFRLPKSTVVTLAPGMIYCRLGITRITPLLKRCSIIFLTKEELATLTGATGLIGTATLHRLGISTVVVTDGSNGSYVSTPYVTIHVPTPAASVVDTTGAGDAFIAGYLWGVVHRKNIKACARAGNLLARFCIGSLGARDGLPKKSVFEREAREQLNKRVICIIGSGGREHAIGWKLKGSPLVDELFYTPGNGGTADIGENIPIASDDIEGLVKFAKCLNIDLTIVGPETPLAIGIVNRFTDAGLAVFGPTKEAARLETSKAWATQFMKRHNLPHPASAIFDDPQKSLGYAARLSGNVVIKADGLCQGKGVFVCDTVADVKNALSILMKEKRFGAAGEKIVIQEKLVGREISVMAFCDGKKAIPLIAASDYKRLKDGNLGPNTGSMGSMAPSKNANARQLKSIYHVLAKTVRGMKQEGHIYKGVLYGGMMIANGKPYILEFNCRFGDPETEVQLPLLKGDLLPILESCIKGSIPPRCVSFKKQSCVCVILASRGYPESSTKGVAIYGLTEKHDVSVFHAGTLRKRDMVVTSGGRVLAVVASDESVEKARKRIYAVMGKQIHFSGMQYRKDIGL